MNRNPKGEFDLKILQSEINIGLVGHVDHGKTTLTKALSGVWTDTHSEEIKRGISIRLGYADTNFYKCPKCNEPEAYTTQEKCQNCGSETEFLRRVSFVDAPGHETLMATMLSGAAIMDGAILVIAANEPCPQPQTAEHLMALDILGIKNIVIAQNKADIVSKDDATKNYNQIKEFITGSVAENAVIIPIVAHYSANVDVLIQAIQGEIPTPQRDPDKNPIMYVARSFDINRPGIKIEQMKGGVIGGSLLQGKFHAGNEIELCPGVKKKNTYKSIRTGISGLSTREGFIDEARPGGLIAIGTNLDPNLAKSDNLAGNIVGLPGTLSEARYKLVLDIKLLNRLTIKGSPIKPLEKSEVLMLSVGSAVTVGIVTNPKSGEINLKRPVCADLGQRVAVSRMTGSRWHLAGYGIIRG